MVSIALLLAACGQPQYGFSTPPEGAPALPDAVRPEHDPAPGRDADTGWQPTPSAGEDSAEILLAWQIGSSGEERATALAAAPDGGILVGVLDTAVSGAPQAGLHRVEADGEEAWALVLGAGDAPPVVEALLPTSDGGAWICAGVPDPAALDPGLGMLPAAWGRSLVILRVDAGGEPLLVRALGSGDGGAVHAGCGLDAAGALVVDGALEGAWPELLFEHGRLALPDLAEAGFLLALDPEGWLIRSGAWPAAGTWREASAVRADGSLVQLVRYTGAPELTVEGARLPPCPEGATCAALLDVGSGGQVGWLGALGPDLLPGARLAGGAEERVLLAARMPADAPLPTAGGPAAPVRGEGTVVAAYGRGMELEWAHRLDPALFVQALALDADGGAALGLWTGRADVVALGGLERALEGDLGTLALGLLDPDGAPWWLWAVQGSGQSWPVALALRDEEIAVAAGLRGVAVLDAGGPTEVTLDSAPDPAGVPSADVVALELRPR